MLVSEEFKDYVLRNIKPELRRKLFYAYNNGLDEKQVKKGDMDKELLSDLIKWFEENGVVEYV